MLKILLLTILLLIFAALYGKKFSLGKEIAVSGTRAIIQIFMLAAIIQILFKQSIEFSLFLLVMMSIIAGHTSWVRSGNIKNKLFFAIISITIASFLLLIPFFAFKVFPFEPRYIIPTGSIFIGNAMNVSSLAIDRYKAEIKNRKSEIECYLALGASPYQAVSSSLKQGILSSLIPSLNNMRNLGIVWIPGIMTGMIFGGDKPLYAASIQVAIFISIFCVNMIAANLMLNFFTDSFFTNFYQLKEKI